MRRLISAAVLTLTVLGAGVAQAAAEADFKSVFAEAQAAHEKSGEHQWTTTSKALKAAKAAADGGDFDKALSLAKQARDLAKQSLHQGESQQAAWKQAIVR